MHFVLENGIEKFNSGRKALTRWESLGPLSLIFLPKYPTAVILYLKDIKARFV